MTSLKRIVVALVIVGAGCGDDDTAPAVDGGPRRDGGGIDASSGDGSVMDSGALDAPAAPDSGDADGAVVVDGAPGDAVTDLDATEPDAGLLDAGGGLDSGTMTAARYARAFGATGGYDSASDVAVDGAGNAYVTGSFEGSVDFGGGALSSAGGTDIFVASYSPTGAFRWAKRFGASDYDEGVAIEVDAAGNAYAVGYFGGSASFEAASLTSAGSSDAFIVAFSPGGLARWAVRFGGTSGDFATDVGLDAASNLWVAGHFQGTMDLGAGPLASAGSADFVIASYTADGAFRSASRFGGTAADRAYAIAVNAAGVYVAGAFEGTMDLGGRALSSAGGTDAFVASFTTAYAHRWSIAAGDTAGDSASGIGVDGSGHTLVSGTFVGSIGFGGPRLSSSGAGDVFVASLDSATGARTWANHYGGSAGDASNGLSVDAAGNVYVTGYFSGTASFGGTSLVAIGSSGDVFVASYDATGAHRWSDRYGESGSDVGFGIDYEGGVVYVCGSFDFTVDFGGIMVTSAGAGDAFLFAIAR